MAPELRRNDEFVYPTTEKVILGSAILLILVFLALNFTNASFRQYFFKTAEDELSKRPVGSVVSVAGTVFRQRVSDSEFLKLSEKDMLYPNDTIMTSTDSGTILQLNGGQKIEMVSNSLIKLAFDFDFALGALVPKIQTVAGEKPKEPVAEKPVVVPVVKKEKPSEEKLILTSIEPADGAKIQVTPEEALARAKMVKLSFKSNRKMPAFKIIIANDGEGKPLLDQLIPPGEKEFSREIAVHDATTYRWEIVSEEGDKSFAKNKFSIVPRVKAIDLLPTEGVNNYVSGKSTKTKFDGFTLKWKAFAKDLPYVISISESDHRDKKVQFRTKGDKMSYSKEGIPQSKYIWGVEQDLPGGFVAVSSVGKFGFEFLPPITKEPVEGAVVSLAKIPGELKKLFFTWEKTNYTDAYDFELAYDREFSSIYMKRTLRDNFIVWTSPGMGKFFWRVRARSSTMSSQFTAPLSFAVQP